MRRLPLAILSTVLVCGLSLGFAPRALAVNCDVNACISMCQKRDLKNASGQGCASWCMQSMEERKKAKQCK